MTDRPRLLLVLSEDWTFFTHRRALAHAARDAGFEVVVACRAGEAAARIEAEGFRVVPTRLKRSLAAPWDEAAALWHLIALYRRERPAVIHHFALKPVLFGSLAALVTGMPAIVNTVAGLGFIFISTQPKARLLRPVLTALFRLLLNRPNARLIVQNEDDRRMFDGIVSPRRIVMVRGSGVDVTTLTPVPEPAGVPKAALVARMLWDKGVGELVEAARILKRRGTALGILLVGKPDPENPRSIDEATLRGWQAEGLIEWRGHSDDIAAVWAEAAIAVLPSYREGLPKALLEAAACGRPLVTADVPGCRELVQNGVTGLLVPVREAEGLADALERLAASPDLRTRLGAKAREMVVAEFSDSVVCRQIVGLYRAPPP